jgi:hypothetical protein
LCVWIGLPPKFELRRFSHAISTPSSPQRFSSLQARLPPLLCSVENGNESAPAVCLAASGDGGSASAAVDAFFLGRSRLACRHRACLRPGACRPDRSDGPHLADGRPSNSQSKTCIVHHEHLSLCHRRRRALPARRFVVPRSFTLYAWRGRNPGTGLE